MLTKSARVPAATVAVALITGIMVALWVALMPAPAHAQSGDVLRLLSIKCIQTTGDEGDGVDEVHLKVDGSQVWSGGMKSGDFVSLAGTSVPLTGNDANVQLWEADTGHWPNNDDGPDGFLANYTGGDQRAHTFTLSSSWGQNGIYEIQYVVDRPPTPTNTAPEIDSPVTPAPGSRTRDRTPLISAFVRDAETDLNKGNITLEVDGVSKPFFSYDAATDKLTYQSGRLSYGRHTVTVAATDGQLDADENWSFKVIKKRR